MERSEGISLYHTNGMGEYAGLFNFSGNNKIKAIQVSGGISFQMTGVAIEKVHFQDSSMYVHCSSP